MPEIDSDEDKQITNYQLANQMMPEIDSDEERQRENDRLANQMMNCTLTFDTEGMGNENKYEIEKKIEQKEEMPRWPAEAPKHEHDWANTLKPEKHS